MKSGSLGTYTGIALALSLPFHEYSTRDFRILRSPEKLYTSVSGEHIASVFMEDYPEDERSLKTSVP